MSLIRPSGGLYWHWRAFRSRTQWLSFSREIGHWLEGFRPVGEGLLLVGPSGGWSMAGEWLASFQHIAMIDPDPAAQVIFKLRHYQKLCHVTYQWERGRFEDWLPEKLQQYPQHAILFCNVLGQLRYERPDYEQVLARLPSQLKGRHWASYHDCLSSEGQVFDPSLKAYNSHARMDETDLKRLKLGGVWTDHGTQGLFHSQHVVRYIPWWFSKTRLHWVQAGCVTPADSMG
jgi:hypothetical protein